MSIPTGYEKLAVIGIAWKGEYTQGTAYKTMNGVYYKGSTYVALRDNPTGLPAADGANWQYLAKGFEQQLLSAVTALDTSGVLGQAGATVGGQALMDAIADKVMTKLIAKSQIANNLLATEPGNVLDATQGKALKDDITELYSDLAYTETELPPDDLWTNGNYYVRNTNTPFGQHGFLRVYSSGQLRVQEFIPFDAAAGTYAIRHQNYGVATDWVVLTSISDLKYKLIPDLGGADVCTLYAGRWCVGNAAANGEIGSWYVEVIVYDDSYRTVHAYPYISAKKYYYFAKMDRGVWQGWEKYISAV